jgi:hypothetical protein
MRGRWTGAALCLALALVIALVLSMGSAGQTRSARSSHSPGASHNRSSHSSRSRPTQSSIASMSIFGTRKRPVFVVEGRRLAVPPSRPHGSPGNRRLCRLHVKGRAGRDYGNGLYVTVYAGAHGRRLYGAGRFHPRSNELDCIGLVIISHSSTRISFTFGSAYSQFSYPPLASGDRVRIVAGSASFSRLVRYQTVSASS